MAKSPVQPDSRILITGAGIIGNLWVTMFHYHGFRDVTVSEPADGRRQITEKLGESLPLHYLWTIVTAQLNPTPFKLE